MSKGNGNQTENRQTEDTILAPGIVRNSGRMSGRTTLAGTRITVANILRQLAGGQTEGDIPRAYPHVTHRQILDALNYGVQLVEPTTLLYSTSIRCLTFHGKRLSKHAVPTRHYLLTLS